MRIREYSDSIPKPMVPIGYRPLLWHLMKYYAHYGHKDFILCLGFKADVVKSYFLKYDECVSNDFVLSNGGKDVRLLSSDIQDWNVTFVDTGTSANIGIWIGLRHAIRAGCRRGTFELRGATTHSGIGGTEQRGSDTEAEC